MNDKLYIIGNGFDRHHGLKTSYDDFRENEAKKSPDLWKFLKIIYGNRINESLWWRDFEEMLGKIDYANVMFVLFRNTSNKRANNIPALRHGWQ